MTDGAYYGRENVVHLDGSRIFQKPEDQRAERDVACLIERVWGCELHPFGALSAIDWFATRYGRVVAVLELKTRSHPLGTYSTVFLNVRKWLALQLAAAGLGVPATFVVKFTDVIGWISLSDINASAIRIGGCSRIVKSRSDTEPVILVPVSSLHLLRAEAA